jgi:hypothetical protein
LLLVGLIAVAVVPDESILRQKVLWSRGLLGSACFLTLLAAAVRGGLLVHWPTWTAAALVPGLLAVLHPIHTPVASQALAADEVERLLVLPLMAWAVASLARAQAVRNALTLVFSLGGIFVGGYAVLQRMGSMLPGGTLAALGLEPTARALAGFGNPVFLGAFLVLVTPIVLAEALTNHSAVRWVASLAAGLCLPALLATASAGSWMGFGTAAAVGLWVLLPTHKHRVMLALALAAAGVVILIVGFDTLTRQRVHTLIWRDSWAMFMEHPGGIGPGQYPLAFLPFASDELLAIHPRGHTIINDAHSEPLQLLVELGWPALLSVAVALLFGLGEVRRSLASFKGDLHERALFAGALAGACGCVGMSFVSPDLRFQVTVLVLGSVLGIMASRSAPMNVPLGGRWSGRVGMALVALVGLWFVGSTSFARSDLVQRIRPPLPPDDSRATLAQIEALQELAAKAPDDPQAQLDLAAALATARHFPEAAKFYRKTLLLIPGEPMVIRSLGIVESFAHNYDRAIPLLRHALEWKPDDPDVRYLLAFCSFARGDLITSLVEVERLLEHTPDHERGRVLLERLRE